VTDGVTDGWRHERTFVEELHSSSPRGRALTEDDDDDDDDDATEKQKVSN